MFALHAAKIELLDTVLHDLCLDSIGPAKESKQLLPLLLILLHENCSAPYRELRHVAHAVVILPYR
jgi:hypothetical protein